MGRSSSDEVVLRVRCGKRAVVVVDADREGSNRWDPSAGAMCASVDSLPSASQTLQHSVAKLPSHTSLDPQHPGMPTKVPTKVPPRRELSETGAVPMRDVMQFPTGHRPVVLEHAHPTRTLESEREQEQGEWPVGHSSMA
jgi:hypothetical protein